MAKLLSNGKWNPIVYDNGFVGMTKLEDGEWELIECDTEEEAEAEEARYKKFWSNQH